MRAARAILPVLLGVLLLVGCSSRPEHRDHAWRQQAEAVCMAKGDFASSYVQRIRRVNGNGACGIWQPLKVSAGLGGMVAFSRTETLNCPMTSALDGWFWHSVQPSALKIFGMPVVEMRTMGAYNCRTRNNRRGARLSEHSFGNALDVAAFRLSDGREISVLGGWRGDADERVFLREIHRGACTIFTTVISPDGDRHHQDHFHFDLARHNASGTHRHCR